MVIGHEITGNEYKPFRSKRVNSLYLGKTGVGKTETFKRLILDDIHAGESVVFIDPTGKASKDILNRIPENRQEDVLLFEPTRIPFASNFFVDVPRESHVLFTDTLIDTIKSVAGYSGSPTPTMEEHLRLVVLTALAVPGLSFLSLKKLLTDDAYRKQTIGQLGTDSHDKYILDLWKDYEAKSLKDRRVDASSTLNKLKAYSAEPNARYCLFQKDNKLVFKDKIVLVSLSESEMGQSAQLLGALILAQIAVEGSRGLKTTVYVDGAGFPLPTLKCPSLTTILSLQSIFQLPEETRDQILSRITQTIAFRTTVKDAVEIEPEFNLKGNQIEYQLPLLPNHYAYALRGIKPVYLCMIKHNYPLTKQAQLIIDRCASQCTAPKEQIEERLRGFF
jgi:hypothetical protein